MKLLKGQVSTVEKDGIKLTVKVIDTATQAIISDLSVGAGIEARIKMISYILKNIIESVEVNGEQFDPKDIATKADISDTETLNTVLNIGGMAMSSVFPSGDEEKK